MLPPLAQQPQEPSPTAARFRAQTPRRPRRRRLESWLWTGPLGHLAGGAVDFLEALARYWIARVRRARSAEPARRGSGGRTER